MPPGGWAKGEYEDPGSPAGDHAIELEVKVTTDGKVSPLLSHAYAVNASERPPRANPAAPGNR